jgi:uncharacterized protein
VRKFWPIVPALLLVGVLALPRDKPECAESYSKDVVVSAPNGATLKTQVSDTEIERELGLGGKTCIPKNSAMLFAFDNAGYYGIWMKGMHFTIDIVWLDGSKNVTHIERNISPDTYPHIYTPDKQSVYVIELHAGKANELGLNVGSQLRW